MFFKNATDLRAGLVLLLNFVAATGLRAALPVLTEIILGAIKVTELDWNILFLFFIFRFSMAGESGLINDLKYELFQLREASQI